ncbi:MAG TPA: VWA domain-containing protein [Candidatus Saccharicenans sp.]|nr:VWA domain-containing protein [Candidatus Saccharicenans sp.]HQI22369.1 VWA domain-containing protein [Candidatus Saccharicenans sp.]HQM74275.1 VWA domain-containing protein [Candidatus Saccharicenans sp.]
MIISRNSLLWPAKLALIFILFSPFTAFAQEKTDQVRVEKPAYKVTVNAVTLAVTVQDNRGRYINNLQEEHFIIYENGEKKTISYFQHDERAPLSLTVLLDVSGSMALDNKFEECRQALKILAEKVLSPRDEVALLVFADGQVEVAAGHSTDKTAFLAALDKEEAYGKTALNDAVAASPQYAIRAKNEKRALLLITDGLENDSQASAEEALDIARRVEVPIYVIGYKIPKAEEILARHKKSASQTPAGIIQTLDLFAAATGGRAFFLDNMEELLASIYDIKKEQSHQYIIGYTSYREDDRYRRLLVITSKGNYRIRTRQGY